MKDYIATPEPVREPVVTLPSGRTMTPEQARALRHLHPGAADLMQVGEVVYLTAWHLPTPQPTEAELNAALPTAQARAQVRAEMNDLQALLDERYVLWGRAQASGNTVDATEIQGEIQSILAYMQEVRNAAGTP